MELWKQLEALLASAKAEFDKYAIENPRLKAENDLQRRELKNINQKVIDAETKLDNLLYLHEKTIAETNELKQTFDKDVAETKTKLDNDAKTLNARALELNQRENEVKKMMSDASEAEKANVAKYQVIEETQKALEKQSEEIRAAAKTLMNESKDHEHEQIVINKRSAELDERELRLANIEATLADRIKTIEANEIKAKQNNTQSNDLLQRNDLLRLDLEKREAFIKNKEADLSRRERDLKARTEALVSSLRTNKVV